MKKRQENDAKKQAVALKFRHAAEALGDAYMALMVLWLEEDGSATGRKARRKHRERKG